MKKNPEHFYTQKAYPRVLRALSHLKSNTGDYAGATRAVDESVALTDGLIKQKPEDYSLRRTGWLNNMQYCEIYVAMQDGRKIVDGCVKTLDFNLKALEKQPDEAFALYDLAISNYYIARGFRLANEPNRSIEYAEKALEPLSKLNKISPGINDYERGIAVIENEIGGSLLLLGKTDEAVEHLRTARAKLEKVVETDKSVKSYQTELAKVYRSAAAAYHKKGDKKTAVEFVEKAQAIIRKLNESNSLRESDKNLSAELEIEKTNYGS